MRPSETAVVFIEFQNEFCKEGGKLYDLVKESITTTPALENAQRLMAGVREKGCLVVHCPFVLDAPWVTQRTICGLLGNLGEGNIFAPGEWGVEIIDELAPLSGEPVVKDKRSISGFANTDLEAILRPRLQDADYH
jgi:nicotinamidase-related amidase